MDWKYIQKKCGELESSLDDHIEWLESFPSLLKHVGFEINDYFDCLEVIKNINSHIEEIIDCVEDNDAERIEGLITAVEGIDCYRDIFLERFSDLVENHDFLYDEISSDFGESDCIVNKLLLESVKGVVDILDKNYINLNQVNSELFLALFDGEELEIYLKRLYRKASPNDKGLCI